MVDVRWSNQYLLCEIKASQIKIISILREENKTNKTITAATKRVQDWNQIRYHLLVLEFSGYPNLEKILKLTEPHLMAISALWYLGQETSAFIFMAFVLGLKVLLVVSFTVTYVCRWWNL